MPQHAISLPTATSPHAFDGELDIARNHRSLILRAIYTCNLIALHVICTKSPMRVEKAHKIQSNCQVNAK